ncbi:MAG: chemotaxis-specific protein-glutamate methyltransferase CheB [Solirubrobacteraceae bacterium]|jgi:two-component system chemotaxis response regulator CheB
MATLAATRVVIADDSALMRSVLSSALRESGIEVVGQAADGDEALALCESLAPDVLSLDLAMPGRDGVSVLQELRSRSLPIPVVVVSAFSAAAGARAVDALAEGAFELVAKPTSRGELDDFTHQLVDRVELARLARPGIAPAKNGSHARTGARHVPAPSLPAGKTPSGAQRIVVIACSTGGPRALAELLPKLPSPLGDGALIVQHMPVGFTASLAGRLDSSSPLTVNEARGNERIDGRHALLAPGGHHMRVGAGGVISLSDEPPVGGLRPRADITIRDAAAVWGERTVLVVMTGMGRDGLEGAQAVREAGGRVIVEARSSCVVHGMPRVVAQAGLADGEYDLSMLPEAILAELDR